MSRLGQFFAGLGWKSFYNGFCRVWKTPKTAEYDGFEVVETTDSVGLLVFNKTDRALVFVSQNRSAAIRPDNPKGEVVEILAGRLDVGICSRGQMVKEALEELGLTVYEHEIIFPNGGFPLAASPGILTEKMVLGYVEVTADRFSAGETFGSDPGEVTRRVQIPVNILESCPFGDMKTWACVQWFIAHQPKKQRRK